MSGNSPEIELIDSGDDSPIEVEHSQSKFSLPNGVVGTGSSSVTTAEPVVVDSGETSSDADVQQDTPNGAEEQPQAELQQSFPESDRSEVSSFGEEDEMELEEDVDYLEDDPEFRAKSLEAKKFLKLYGRNDFVEKYLPEIASYKDITKASALLGYRPTFAPYEDSKVRVSKAVTVMQKAMTAVLNTRIRLDHFNTIDQFVETLRTCDNIMVLTGAGISTSLGIPDFRSSQGFYSQIRNLGLSDPQDVFDLETFREEPQLFYSIAHMVLPPENSYTVMHAFIKLLEEKGKLLRNYTQNIDNLEENAGLSKDRLVQCHGSFATATCVTCGFRVPGTTIFEEIRARDLPICPWCKHTRDADAEDSYGVMKPDITFFGEALPARYHDLIVEDRTKCDLLICVGTSLKVAPVSEIVNQIHGNVPQILINKDPVTHCEFDLSLLGYCDQVICYVCSKLGWKIDHPDFDRFVNNELHCFDIDPLNGVYEVNDKYYRQKVAPET